VFIYLTDHKGHTGHKLSVLTKRAYMLANMMKMIIMYQMVCGSVGASPRCTVARAFHRILYGHYVVCTYAMGSSVAERMADGCNGYQARN
jgi:hypothetical protein